MTLLFQISHSRIATVWRIFLRKEIRAAHFSVSKTDSLADEKIDLSLHGLPPSSKVTLHSEVVLREKFKFSAFGFHHSDGEGTLLPSNDPSIGGTYTGADPMGLIWSLKPDKGQRKGLRFLPDVTVPSELKLYAYRGHCEDVNNAEKLAETAIRRHWISDDVSYEHVRHGKLRGMLFVPKDKSRKYPGVLDIYGGGGGLLPQRGALLASKGFVTFCLAHVRYDDLPESGDKVDMEYFLSAVDYLRHQESVEDCGIGAIGMSKGADFLVETAVLSSHVKVVAFLNGLFHPRFSDLHLKGNLYRKMLHTDFSKSYVDRDGNLALLNCFLPEEYPESMSIPFEQIHGKIGIFVSGEDKNVPSVLTGESLMKKMKDNGRAGDCELHTFDRAGHILDPAYLPHCPAQYLPHVQGGQVVAFGGTPAEHKEAQLRFWPLLIEFFRRHLKKDS